MEHLETLSLSGEMIKEVFGSLDKNIKMIEKACDVNIIDRDGKVIIMGKEYNAIRARKVIEELVAHIQKGNSAEEQVVNYILDTINDNDNIMNELDADAIAHTVNGKVIKPKTAGQKEYIDAIRNKMIVFGEGPAGTGKTYLAMAMAINAFKKEEVSRIILTRPAIEAGEKLGFLPGDLQSKVDPYLRPLYDALYQIMGPESFIKNSEKGLIEVAPLAYMRGRTLDNSFIILDEAQNTTPAQMKMFLTRIGFGSKAVITGDLTQKDIPQSAVSGLEEAKRVLNKIDEIKFVQLTSKDVVRHSVVMKIVKAYDDYEAAKARNNKRAKK